MTIFEPKNWHSVRKATAEEAKHDCCGDRYTCNVGLACSCGFKGCEECMKDHLLELHEVKRRT